MEAIAVTAWIDSDAILCEPHGMTQSTEIVLMRELRRISALISTFS